MFEDPQWEAERRCSLENCGLSTGWREKSWNPFRLSHILLPWGGLVTTPPLALSCNKSSSCSGISPGPCCTVRWDKPSQELMVPSSSAATTRSQDFFLENRDTSPAIYFRMENMGHKKGICWDDVGRRRNPAFESIWTKKSRDSTSSSAWIFPQVT